MTLNYVTLTLDLYDGQGNPIVAGSASFTPTVQLTDTTDHELTVQAPVPAVFHSGGLPAVKLLATDNGTPLPAGWAWQVSFSGVPGNPAGFTFFLPYTGGSSQYLSSQAPVSSGVTFYPYAQALTQTAVQTSAYAAAANQLVPVNTTSGSVTVTLPAAPPAGTMAGVKIVTLGSGHAVTVASAGSDVFNKSGGGTSLSLLLLNQGVLLQYDSGIWYVVSDDLPLSQLDARYGATYLVPAPTGATATDTANVAAAITKLTTATGNGTLLFQDGTYQVDSNALVIRSCSNFAVRGSGATIIEQAPNRAGLVNNVTGNLFTIADSTDFRVEGITFDGLRDTLAPMTPLTASASSGQPSVTVASGQGANYKTGQNLLLFGGLTTGDQNLSDGYAAGSGVPLVIQSIAAGVGSGGGDLITFTTNLGNSYTQISSTSFTDGFGLYAYAGAYLTPYQAAYQNSVAGRTLSGEDQQCGLHLISCQRFTVSRVTARNVWESPVKCGTGFASTSLTDGCQQGTITDCITYHAYDQGISVWVSKDITVKGCVANATGWAGVSLSESDDCTVTGNQLLNQVYRVPNDTSSGYGLAIEGGLHNQVKGNIITAPYEDGIWLRTSPLGWGLYGSTSCSLSSFLAAQTAAGTSIQVSSSANAQVGGRYSLVDGTRTEALTVATIPDGTHLTFSENIMFSHAAATYLMQRIGQENTIEGNTIYGPQFRDAIHLSQCVRQNITGNTIRNWGLGAGSTGSGVVFDYSTTNLASGVWLGGDGSAIDGNIIAGGLGNGIIAATASTSNLSGLKIRGNDIYGLMNAANVAGINLKNVTDSIVSDNKVTDLESAVGIWIQNTSSGTAPARVTVSGNRVRRCSSAGILAQTCDSLTITGNSVSSCGGHSGINGQGLTHSVIADNICNSNQNGGIKLEDNSAVYCQYNQVTGNTCRDDGSGVNVTTGNSWTQPHGIVEAGNSNNNLFTGNECDSNGTDQLTTAGAASYAWANVLSGSPSGNFPAALLPSATTSAQGAVILDGTAGDIQPPGITPAAGSKGQAADAKHVHALAAIPTSAWPSGALAQTVQIGILNSSALAVASGTMQLFAVMLQAGQTVSNITFLIGTTAGATLTHGWFALLADSTFTQLAHSADQTSGSLTASTLVTKAMTTPYAVTSAGKYWVAITVVAGTQPTLAAETTLTQAAAAFAAFPVAGAGSTGLSGPGTDGTTTYVTPTAAGSNAYAYVS